MHTGTNIFFYKIILLFLLLLGLGPETKDTLLVTESNKNMVKTIFS